MEEQSVVLVKPDAMKKKLVGQVIDRFERAGLHLAAMKIVRLSDAILDVWYAHHKEKPFFPSIKSYMMSTPVVAMLWKGEGVIAKIRELCGPTDSRKAVKGTIRGDFGKNIQENVVHASDSQESAQKEVELLFEPQEIHEY